MGVLVALLLAAVFYVLTIPLTFRAPLPPDQYLGVQLGASAAFLLALVLAGLPLWRYVQWTSGLVEMAEAGALKKRGLSLRKWLGFLRSWAILQIVFDLFTIAPLIIHFKPTGLNTRRIFLFLIDLSLSICWLRLLRSLQDWIDALLSGHTYLQGAALNRNIAVVIAVIPLGALGTLVEPVFLNHRWWGGLPFVFPAAAIILLLVASRRFSGATSAPLQP
ncbi:MAG: hypothetical protein ACR2J4_11340, partial [Deinococcus sp.]